jgi:hypothetical protein
MREPFTPATWSVGEKELLAARRRWMRAGYSAILRCADTEGIGMRGFLEVGDKTQRQLVGKTAIEFYRDSLGLTEDSIDTFFGVTNLGVVGSGFDYEVARYTRATSVSAEQYRCPLIDHVHAAGYQNGDKALQDLSLWCDMYDNFESAAVAPSVGMIHSHCLGLGDHQCRWYIEILDPKEVREDDEHIHDYLGRMRESRRGRGDGPWVIDGKTPEDIDRITRENVQLSEDDQDKLWPTTLEKLEQGVLVSSRIGSASLLIAGELLGWDSFVERMEEKEGPILTQAAKETAEERGIYGDTPQAGAVLHEALTLGTLFGPYEIEESTEDRVVASCATCPLVEAGRESGLEDPCSEVSVYCSAAATYEVQALSKDLSQTYTACLGKGDSVCRWVIEKKDSAA